MKLEVMLPLFALCVWLLLIYAENKFAYFYERKNYRKIAHGQRGWKRFLIDRNIELKYVGLGLLWVGFSLGMVLTDREISLIPTFCYGVGIAGLTIYVISRLWLFVGGRSGSN